MKQSLPEHPAPRRASYTSADHSEVELSHPHEGLPGDAENGKKRLAYYSPERYTTKQAEHGSEIYPEPTPFTN